MQLYVDKSSAQEKEEALNSDDDMPQETEESPDSHESGDDDDYEIVSVHEDEPAEAAEASISNIVPADKSEDCTVKGDSTSLVNGQDSVTRQSLSKVAEAEMSDQDTEDQAVPNGEASRAERMSALDLDEQVDLWSDVEAQLTNDSTLGASDEERARIINGDSGSGDDVDLENECARLEKEAATDHSPRKKARLEATEGI